MVTSGAYAQRIVEGFPHLWHGVSVFKLFTERMIYPLVLTACDIISKSCMSKGIRSSAILHATVVNHADMITLTGVEFQIHQKHDRAINITSVALATDNDLYMTKHALIQPSRRFHKHSFANETQHLCDHVICFNQGAG